MTTRLPSSRGLRASLAYGLWLLLALLLPLAAAATAPGGGATPSLASALNPDGTLRADAHGSFDAKDYTIGWAANGQPAFRPASVHQVLGTGDERWQDGFGTGTGLNGIVNALAVDGSGNVYVGGGFTQAGGNAASNIAKWNGTAWSALGSGVNNSVYSLAVDGTGNVYAGGVFTQAGGSAASRIAKWNGTAWSALGTGMSGAYVVVYALAVDGAGSVYAGGIFTQAGGSPAKYMAKWNGTTWSALGTGLNDTVFVLAVDGSGNVYAGGAFTQAGGNAASNIAKWNGTTWSALGTGLDGFVNALAVDGSGNVYAGGYFTQAGGSAAKYVAKWNGTTWSALGTGLDNNLKALAVDGSGNVYAGGQFTQAGGSTATNIAKWNGTTWSALGTGLNDGVYALAVNSSGNVYAGGRFTTVGDGSKVTAYFGIYLPAPPTLTTLSPVSGTAGSTLAATGTALTGATAITFTSSGGMATAASAGFVAGAASITGIVVPTGLAPGTYTVAVTAPGGTSNRLTFTVVSPPAISSFSPTSGVAGASITLTGTDLTGASSVRVNGVAVTPTGVSSTSLTFLVPAGASATQSVSVTSPNGTSAASTAFTVLLQVASMSPVANARTAPLANSAVALTFTEPVTAASAAGLRVYSTQAGGRKAGTVTMSGTTASFAATAGTPRTNFKPGETVSVSVPATVGSTGGLTAPKRVYQFTTAVGGTGRGNFRPSTDPAVGTQPVSVAAGDMDGDGDLDLVTANYNGGGSGSVSVRLNGGNNQGTNTGIFSGNSNTAVGNGPLRMVLGDVDGDGDLDLVTANTNSNGTVSVLLNGGNASGSNTGQLSGGSTVGVGAYPIGIALADVDGDGDLDLLVANSGETTVSVLLNGGNASGSNTGTFSGGGKVQVGGDAQTLAVGDVDGDGDLDLVTAGKYYNTVGVRLNGGDATGSNTGIFSGGSNIAVTDAYTIALGDVDGDGDLDILVTSGPSTVRVLLNGGNNQGTNTGTFSGGSSVAVGGGITLGDVDGDGDLDILVTSGPSTVSVRLNGGDATGSNTGIFSGGSDPAVGQNPNIVALGDVDGDGDLDMLVSSGSTNTVSVRLNQAPAPTISNVTPDKGAVSTSVVITGTNLTGATTVTFNGTTAPGFVVNANGTSITVSVPTGATSGPIAVTMPGGTATSATAFTVLVPPTLTFANVNATYGDPVSLAPTSNSTGAYTYTLVSGTGATVTAAGQVTLTGVGTVVISVTQAADATHTAGSATATLTIAPRPLTVAADAQAKVFGTADPALTYQLTTGTLVGSDALSGALTRTPGEDMGSYAITNTLATGALTASPNYALTFVPASLRISPAAQTISFATLPAKTFGDADFTVSATAALPVSFAVTGSATLLADGQTVHLTRAGTVTVTATQAGGGNYTAATAVTQTFAVAKAPATLTLSNLTPTYTGAAQAATATTTPAGLAGISLSYAQGTTPVATPTDAGDYTVTATLDNPDYVAPPVNGTLTIGKATATVTLTNLSPTYDGSAKAATATTTAAGTSSFTLDYAQGGSPVAQPTAAGSYQVTATLLNANYRGTATGTLVIGKADQTITVSDHAPASAVYGSDFTVVAMSTSGLPVTYTSTGPLAAKSAAGTFTLTSGTGTGTVTYAQAGDDNYNPAPAVTENVGATKQAAQVTVAGYAGTYDGAAHGATGTATGLLGADLSAQLTLGASFSDAPGGTANWSFAGGDNYQDASGTALIAIGKAPATLALGTSTFTYDGTAKPVAVTTTPANLTGVGITYQSAATAPTNAGSYALAATLTNSNYEAAPISGTLTIGQVLLTPSIAASSKVYDGTTTATLSSQTISGLVNGETAVGLAVTTATFDTPNQGTGKTVSATGLSLTGAAAANYRLAATATALADITPATLTYVAAPASRPYGIANSGLSGTVTGFVGTESVPTATSGTLTFASPATAASPVGTYPIEGSGLTATSGNYTLGQAATNATALTITPATPTVVAVAATNLTYSGTAKAATATATGVNGNADLLSPTPTLSYSGANSTTYGPTATAPTNVGDYAVTAAFAGNDNYSAATSAPVAFSISPALLTVSTVASSKVYGEANPAFAVTYVGLVNNETPAALGGTLAFTTTATASSPVGSYAVTPGGLTAANYALTFAPANLTIGARPLTVTATGMNKVYDATTGATVTLSDNRLSSDAATLVTTYAAASFATKTVDTAKPVSVSGIALSGAAAGNYSLTSPTAKATADITALATTASFLAADKGYDGTPAATVTGRTVTAALVGDAVALGGGVAAFNNKNVGTGKPVSLTGAALTGADAGNYTLTTVAPTTAAITARTLAVTATGVNKVYDGNTNATVTLSDNRVSGDVLTPAYTSAAFADANVGTGKAVAVSGISLSGPDAGNYLANATATTTANITAVAPTLTVPTVPTTPASASQCGASVSFAATASGAPAPTITYTIGSGATVITSPYLFAVGTTTVTATATNVGGSVTKTFAVTVTDQTAPAVRTQNLTVALQNGTATITPAQVDNGSTDACGIATRTLSKTTFSCTNIGANTVTLTVTDSHGNVATQTATVTVTGSLPAPAVALKPASSVYTGGNAAALYLGYGPQSVTLTASGGTTYQWSPAAGLSASTGATTVFTAIKPGIYTYLVTATSASGCQATTSVTLTVSDVRCGNKNDKVIVCHQGNALCIDDNAVAAHLDHGDQLGNCPTATTAKASTATASATATTEGQMLNLHNLLEVYPNPMAAQAILHFRTAEGGKAQVYVYDQVGRLVTTLYNAEVQRGQDYTVALTGADYASGVYFCRLIANGQVLNVRLTIAK